MNELNIIDEQITIIQNEWDKDFGTDPSEDYTEWLEKKLAVARINLGLYQSEFVALKNARVEQPAPASPLVTIGGVTFVRVKGYLLNTEAIDVVTFATGGSLVLTFSEDSLYVEPTDSAYPALCALFGFTHADK